jgi:hypothetical protein
MTDQSTAVTTTDPPPAITTEVVQVAGRGQIERITAKVTIPPDYQYAIEKWSVDEARGLKANGKPHFMKEVTRVGLTVDAYDYMNRVLGVSFFFPDTVPDEHGKRVPNPIWTPPDFTTVLMGATWINPMGQQVVAFELVSTDFWRIYQDKRANADGATPAMDPDGVPYFDKRGDMVLELSADEELKAYKELTRNRALGPRYAQTVGRVRLLKEASGIRSLPTKVVRAYPLTLTGFRDPMQAKERVAAAASTEASLYGRPVDEDKARVTAQEMAEVGEADDDDRIIAEAERVTDEQPDTKTWTKEELAAAGL